MLYSNGKRTRIECIVYINISKLYTVKIIVEIYNIPANRICIWARGNRGPSVAQATRLDLFIVSTAIQTERLDVLLSRPRPYHSLARSESVLLITHTHTTTFLRQPTCFNNTTLTRHPSQSPIKPPCSRRRETGSGSDIDSHGPTSSQSA